MHKPRDEGGPRNRGNPRRGFLKAAAASGAALSMLNHAQAAAETQTRFNGEPGSRYVIRRGSVLSMDRAVGDFAEADVLVEGNTIKAIGPNLSVGDAPEIDARGCLVMPGFVDTHCHLWNTFLRGSIRGDDPARGYFPVTNLAGPLCTPEDAYNSVRFGIAQELLSGITTVNNYAHNVRSAAHADSEIKAMLETGIRGRFSYGPAGGRTGRVNMADVARLQATWRTNPRLTIGVNLENPPPTGPIDTFIREVTEARRLGAPISLHSFANPGLYEPLQSRGFFGPDVLFIHAQGFTDQQRQILVTNGVKLSMSPVIEMPYSTVRSGYIQFDELEQLGAKLSLSIDSIGASANADFFNVMRALQFSHKQRADTKTKLLPRRIVELATIDGARTLGLDGQVGSLTPGKKADIIMVRKTDINMVPVMDPYFSLVYSGLPQNVDTVVVDGKMLVANGKLTSLDVGAVITAANSSAQRLELQMSKSLP
ncbi:MAG: cytosine deaminase [Ramlibacter sp.]|nr:cytosine deaminase [Ramlibacter sp.]